MGDLVNSEWRNNIQAIVESHHDVEIVCTLEMEEVTHFKTSSILLSAYSSVLRRTFNTEEDSHVIFCPDFSHQCVKTGLQFLTYGQSRFLDKDLAKEVYLFFQSLAITGFTIDGYKPVTWGDRKDVSRNMSSVRVDMTKGRLYF